MKARITIKAMGYQTILIQWDQPSDHSIVATIQFLDKEYPDEILEMVPAFRELAVYLQLDSDKEEVMEKLNRQLPLEELDAVLESNPIYRIPVSYAQKNAPDIERMAKEKESSIQDLINLHTAATYQIQFLGFLPGFPYLKGLNPKLHQPRLPKPRAEVPAGAVGIAGSQSGIYPRSSPGGWNIIGRTPISLFDIQQNPPAKFQAADRLQFFAVDDQEYHRIEKAVKKRQYQLEKSYD